MLKTNRVQVLRSTTGVRVLEAKAGSTQRTRGRAWQETRARILKRDQFACASCGRVHLTNQVDHITPLEAGGADDDSNLQTLCVDCHKAKTAAEAKARWSC